MGGGGKVRKWEMVTKGGWGKRRSVKGDAWADQRGRGEEMGVACKSLWEAEGRKEIDNWVNYLLTKKLLARVVYSSF